MASAAAASAAVWCGASSHAQSAETCAVPGYLLFGDSLLQRVTELVAKDKTLRIVVLGGASSTLPGPDGAQYAYPARLEVALKQLLPTVAVTVTADIKTRQSAEEAADGMDKLQCSTKSRIWWYGRPEHTTRYAEPTWRISARRLPTASKKYRPMGRTSFF